MKCQYSCSWMIAIVAFFLLFQSCTKDTVSSNNTVTELTTSSVASLSGDTEQLILQPGPEDGIDTWLTWQQRDSVLPNTNWDTVNIIAGYAWTNRGTPIRGRSLLKFAGLSSIPSSAGVVSARLYLYGVPSNLRLTSGNSRYPGSPYHANNSLAVLRVIENWNESTATWNRQPAVTLEDHAAIPTSTSKWNYDTSVDVTSMVAKMVAQPAKNFGFMFRQAKEDDYKNMMFASSDYVDPAKRPKLVITYK